MKRKMKSLLGFLLAALVCLTGCVNSSVKDVAVMQIDGQEIMKSEYMVYLYTTTESFISAAGEDVWNMDFDGQSADELVEERTINTIQSVIAAKEYAVANGIALTEEQKAAAAAAADQFMQTVSAEDLEKMNIDVKKLQPLMEDSYLYTLVHQEIAAECEVAESDVAEYYREQGAELKKDYTTLKLQTILLNDGEKAAEAADRAKAGEDFLKLFDEYDVDSSAENGGEMTVYQNYLQTTFGVTDEMEKGDVAGPLQIGEGWFLLKAVEKTVPTEEEVRELAENMYRSEVQSAYTEIRFTDMIKLQKVEKIESVWEGLEKFH